MLLRTLVLAALGFTAAASAQAQTELQWWHAMTGGNNDVIVRLAEEFNGAQKDYRVVPVYKGSYSDTHERRHRGVPGRQPAAHPASLRGRHRHDDGGERRREAGPSAMQRPANPSIRKPICRRSPAITRPPTGEMLSFPFNSSVDGDVGQPGRAEEGRASTLTSRRKPGPSCSRPPRNCKTPASATCGFSTAWIDLGPHRAVLGLAQPAARHQGQRP